VHGAAQIVHGLTDDGPDGITTDPPGEIGFELADRADRDQLPGVGSASRQKSAG